MDTTIHNNKKENLTDFEKLELLSDKIKSDFISELIENSGIINESIWGMTVSTFAEWYKIFISSIEFQKYSQEFKKCSFDQFTSLTYTLKSIDDFMEKYRLGTYNTKLHQ